ncbi:MAG: hypothetical protein HRT44_13760, partial [Bdellovibrionales bacterium]|nr:hypothetical protein [Bdellovibrionales bacterium]NQZ20303.1 hypothetical protein [Bdellovibrionales bacterium]
MKVLYDVTALLNPHITGVGMYTRNLYRGLRGLGIDVNPIYMGKGKVQNIEAHLNTTPKVFRSMFMPKNSVIHGTDVNMISDS